MRRFLFLSLFFLTACVPQQVAAAKQNPNPYEFVWQTVMYFLIGLGVYWALVLKPQQLKREETKKFLEQLKRGDDVVTSGGVIGKVHAVSPEVITIEVAQGVRIKVLSANVTLLPKSQDSSGSSEEVKEKK